MKGQYFSFDAIIASVIFILALVALLSYWHSVKSFLDYQSDAPSVEAIRLSNLLFTPAAPSSDCASMETLGFAISWNDRRVNSSVIECAAAQDQNWLQSKLGGSRAYNVSLIVTDFNTGLETPIGGGIPTSPAPSDVVKIQRLATVLNDSDGSTHLASFELSLYR